MNAPFQHPARVDKATFYRLTRDTPGKAELKDGRIVQQRPTTTKIWQRGDGRRFPPKPFEVKGRDGAVEVTSLAIGLPMRELFRTIPDPA